MNPACQPFEPGSLRSRLQATTASALASGALQPIPTASETLVQDEIEFRVRISANVERKVTVQHQRQKRSPDFNPFLPYEAALFVADFSPTHLCLLNKFNVVEHHALIVTRAFEPQTDWLNERDFAALWQGLCEFDSLGFYNAGAGAGASQRHKHLQLVPLPLAGAMTGLPISPAIARAEFTGGCGRLPAFDFPHALSRLDASLPPVMGAVAARAAYQQLLAHLGIHTTEQAHNVLATRDWLLIVPRSQPEVAGIGINSLGFAGSFFVRDRPQLALLQNLQPLNVLRTAAIADTKV
ncbi:MAG: phosphorylase [Spirulinaceae cyanobacterium SM2_1_0]|nr:phosphorylase [Spirulinaceae cyanobacterium SM2_1_0]